MLDTFHGYVEYGIGQPALLCLILFIGTFILEEAALMAGALLAAADELYPWEAIAALYAGIVVSDFGLYALGRASGTWPRLRRYVDGCGSDAKSGALISRGREMLDGSLFSALLTARLVPWLLFPVLVSCGLLRIGFLRFAGFTIIIAAVYTVVVFGILYLVDELLFEWFSVWAVIPATAIGIAIIGFSFYRRRRAAARKAEPRPAAVSHSGPLDSG